jgi:hypothetical protein
LGDLLATITQRVQNRNTSDRRCYILRDIGPWITGLVGASQCRQLRNLLRILPAARCDALIAIAPSGDVPAELADMVAVVEWPAPDRDEIAEILNSAIASQPEERDGAPYRATLAPNGTREQAIDAAIGLSGEEAATTFAKSIATLKRIDPATIYAEKKRTIARDKILTWLDPLPGGLDSVGGLDVIKAWIKKRSIAYSQAARAYGLLPPKGIFLLGVQGCGKTMIAKAIATALNGPLIKFDPNAGKGKYVGESEANSRQSYSKLESIGRCVVLFDEIEKSMAGAVNGAADGGVSADF